MSLQAKDTLRDLPEGWQPLNKILELNNIFYQ